MQTGPDGNLAYPNEPGTQNRIPDFSHAGYGGGGVPLPVAPVVSTLSPSGGDDTAAIQAAINAAGALPANGQGVRGAVKLTAGAFIVNGTLNLTQSGVVLRGAGMGADPSLHTILRRSVNGTATVIKVAGAGNNKWETEETGSQSNITTPFVQVGSRSFEVADPAKYQLGDNIVIYHPCTQGWLEAVNFGETGGDTPWGVGSRPIRFNRFIRSISGNTITVDAPVFNHLDSSLSQSYIYRTPRGGLVSQVGLENFRVENNPPGTSDTSFPEHSVEIIEAENCWLTGVEVIRYARSAFRFATVTRSTVKDCRLDIATGSRVGGRMYGYRMEGAQLVLVENCIARDARHGFVGNGATYDSGVVFLDCRSQRASTASEIHQRWGMGFLYDGFIEEDTLQIQVNLSLLLGLRKSYGTGHGWSAAHSVAWNCDVNSKNRLCVQRPPTAQNYAIGCRGKAVDGSGYFSAPAGYIEGVNQTGLFPSSLYRAQLADRLDTEPEPGPFSSMDDWTPQFEAGGGGEATVADNKMTVHSSNGWTIWYNQRLTGPVKIEYDVTLPTGQIHSRVSDLNVFWMASDPADPNSTMPPVRNGVLSSYDNLKLYYVGAGGNNNSSTRFRRYPGDGTRPLLPAHDLNAPLLQGNRKYHVTCIANGDSIQYYLDDQLVFDFTDPAPFTSGFFGFRAVNSRHVYENFRVTQLPGGGGGDITPPAAPATPTPTSAGVSAINIDWADNTDPDLAGYRLYRSTSTGFTPGPGNQIGGDLSASSYSDSELSSATTYYYRVTAFDVSGNESAPSAQASATTPTPGTGGTEIPVLADSFVRDGNEKAVNYGTNTLLTVKDAAIGFNRDTYMKFNVSGAAGALSAALRLNVISGSNFPVTVKLYRVAGDGWTEGGVTWENKPALGALLATVNVTSAGTLDFDILSTLQAESDGVLSLALTGSSNQDKFFYCSSKEASNPALAPKIVVTYPDSAESYSNWQAQQQWGAIPVDQRDSTDDPDRDGSSNALERYFGTDPASVAGDRFPLLEIFGEDEGGLSIVLTFPKAVEAATFQMEGSANLATWSVLEDASLYFDAESGLAYFSYHLDPATDPLRFFRIAVRE